MKRKAAVHDLKPLIHTWHDVLHELTLRVPTRDLRLIIFQYLPPFNHASELRSGLRYLCGTPPGDPANWQEQDGQWLRLRRFQMVNNESLVVANLWDLQIFHPDNGRFLRKLQLPLFRATEEIDNIIPIANGDIFVLACRLISPRLLGAHCLDKLHVIRTADLALLATKNRPTTYINATQSSLYDLVQHGENDLLQLKGNRLIRYHEILKQHDTRISTMKKLPYEQEVRYGRRINADSFRLHHDVNPQYSAELLVLNLHNDARSCYLINADDMSVRSEIKLFHQDWVLSDSLLAGGYLLGLQQHREFQFHPGDQDCVRVIDPADDSAGAVMQINLGQNSHFSQMVARYIRLQNRYQLLLSNDREKNIVVLE